MKRLINTVLYIALSLGASALGTSAVLADIDAAKAAREGDMKKLVFHKSPSSVPEIEYVLADGAGMGKLSDYRGKYVLLNFWATWCAPCRKEMPYLSELQAIYGGDTFQVVTIAAGRNSPEGIVTFFEEIGVSNLPRHQDPKQKLAAAMGVLGLPITVIIDPEGNEIARLRGDANWASGSAKAVIQALLAGQ